MSLLAGSRLGSYTIEAPLGAGGMGEVYRARDTKLNREVALKVLPEVFAQDPDRLGRFKREAQLLASLNHANIAAIYGFEEAAPSSVSGQMTLHALVLELVEGPTLAELIAGPSPRGMPVSDALPIARQIARALEAAHEQGILHRDLKPANIKVRSDGTVKVLDFGLAKALDPLAPAHDATLSPTITSPAMTRAGVVLGTAAYMSPEQARGRAADKRSDVWAFGCVLYEMLTGTRAFHGGDISDTIAAVLRDEPDWSALPQDVPPGVRTLLQRCLQKDHTRRLRDIGDAGLEIEDARSTPPVHHPAPAKAFRRREPTAWTMAAGVLAVAALAFAGWAIQSAPAPREIHVEITTPPLAVPEDMASLAVSPDGRRVAFVAQLDGNPRLWLRSLESHESRPLSGTDGAAQPFWSPDGRSLAFFTDSTGQLKRLDLDGERVRALAEAAAGMGGSWNRDGTILFVPTPGSPVSRVSAEGGTATQVTRLETGQAGHWFPQFLPDGNHFIYYVQGDTTRGIYVGALDEPDSRKVFDSEKPAVYLSGHLLFFRETSIFAQPFDAKRLAPTGAPLPVARDVTTVTDDAIRIIGGADGVLAFRRGAAPQRQLRWRDRSGKELGPAAERDPSGPVSPVLSPDGGTLALLRRVDGNADVWLLDMQRGVLSRFTDHPQEDVFPLWSRDGTRIVFTSNRGETFALYEKHVKGQADEKLLLPGAEGIFASDWSPDGRLLLLGRLNPRMGGDILAMRMSDRKPFPVVATGADERNAQLSPNGRWVAYQSNSSGRTEVYVQPFPGPGFPQLVSTAGGAQVRWRSDGRELFYLGLDGTLMAVSVRDTADPPRLDLGVPAPLFTAHVGNALVASSGAQYVVSRDGQRFLLNTLDESTPPIAMILNWQGRQR